MQREYDVSTRSITELLTEARETYGVFGKAQRALTQVEQVLALAPESVEALNLKAAILYELDRDEEAVDYHRRALAIEPHSVEALHGLGALANDRQEYARALEWLDTAFRSIADDPNPELKENEDYRQRLLAELYKEKAFALWYTGRKEEALQLLNHDAPAACPLEEENFEEELSWLEEHPVTPDDE